MPRYIHPEDDRVFACPHCNRGGQVFRRLEPASTPDGREFKCQECLQTFDEPVEREDQSVVPDPKIGPTSGLGKLLEEADADAIGGD